MDQTTKKLVKTRIDKILVEKIITERVTKIEIVATRVLYHNAVMWGIATEIKKIKKRIKISGDMIENEAF